MFRVALRAVLRVVLLGLMAGSPAQAEEALLKPFVLGTTPAGNQEQVVAAVKMALKGQGFEEAGSYSPYAGVTVIAVTSPELKAAAAKSEHGGFGAALRVKKEKRK